MFVRDGRPLLQGRATVIIARESRPATRLESLSHHPGLAPGAVFVGYRSASCLLIGVLIKVSANGRIRFRIFGRQKKAAI